MKGIEVNAPVSYFEDILVFFKKYETNPGHLLREYSRRVRAFTGATAAQVGRVLGHGGANHFWRADTVQFSLPTRSTYEQLTAAYNLNVMQGFMTYDEMKHSEMALPQRVFNLPPGKRHKPNILKYARDREKYHPTQKPVALLEDLIQTYSNPGDMVLDFTMGSGSTGVACINTGRRFIGIEKEQRGRCCHRRTLSRFWTERSQYQIRNYQRPGKTEVSTAVRQGTMPIKNTRVSHGNFCGLMLHSQCYMDSGERRRIICLTLATVHQLKASSTAGEHFQKSACCGVAFGSYSDTVTPSSCSNQEATRWR